MGEADHSLANALEGLLRTEAWHAVVEVLDERRTDADETLRNLGSTDRERQEAAGAWNALTAAINAPTEMIHELRGRDSE